MGRKADVAQLRAWGFTVSLDRPESKIPAAKGWQNPTEEWVRDVLEVFPTANPTALLGPTSRMVAIDVDAKGDLSVGLGELVALEEKWGELPATWSVRTPTGGIHLYFKCDSPLMSKHIGECQRVEIKATGGKTTLPPSVHPNGGVYKWRPNLSPEDLPLAWLPVRWILNLPMQSQQPKEPPVVIDPKVITSDRRERQLDRAKDFARSRGPAISGERGHDTTFGTLCGICRLVLTAEDAREVAEWWNDNINNRDDRWSATELGHKLAGALEELGKQTIEGYRARKAQKA